MFHSPVVHTPAPEVLAARGALGGGLLERAVPTLRFKDGLAAAWDVVREDPRAHALPSVRAQPPLVEEFGVGFR